MPLTAEARPKESDDEYDIIDITEFESPRLELVDMELRCPDCKSPMHVVASIARLPHFRHNRGHNKDCSFTGNEGESIRHIYSKVAISNKLAETHGYEGAKIIKEHWLGDVARRADIFVLYPDGATEVHEIQLATTTVDSLEERANGYKRAGVDEILWWFGGQADTQGNRNWAKEKLGGYGVLSITDGQERVL